jgi:hypothetical protein
METRIEPIAEVLDRRYARFHREARGLFGVGKIEQLLEDFDIAIRTGQESYYLGPIVQERGADGGLVLVDGYKRLIVIAMLQERLAERLARLHSRHRRG